MHSREALFISHANPEDNAFALWLGAKLAAMGYEVWADVMRVRGGSDWARELEVALRTRAFPRQVRGGTLRTAAIGIRSRNGNANRVAVDNFLSRLWNLVDNQSGLNRQIVASSQ